ncbi:hypothetical protein ScPMuIL_018189 [Solemya velum]
MGINIYFAGSIRGGRDDADLYARIIKQLQAYGTVFTEHVGSDTKTSEMARSLGSDKAIYDQDMSWLQQSDVIVAEVTQTSTGVGFELGRVLSAMIGGAVDSLQVENYVEEDLPNILKKFFEKNT